MDDPRATDEVVAKLGKMPGEALTPEALEAIQTAMHENLGRFIYRTTYFVLGSYGEEERPRLEAVKTSLDGEERAAFLMDDIHDVTEFFTSKFKLLVSYADHIVGVYEHSRGGHAWEAGYVDQPEYRARTHLFYRIYETDEEQFEAYDGMFAHCLLSMERIARARSWRTTEELVDEVVATYGK